MRRKLSGAGRFSGTRAILYCAVAMLFGQVDGPALAQGDVEAGRLKGDTCMGCHGIPGYTAVYPTYHVPKLGGQHAEYIVSALEAYKTGLRDHETMHAQAEALSAKDMADIAAYFESLGSDVTTAQKGQAATAKKGTAAKKGSATNQGSTAKKRAAAKKGSTAKKESTAKKGQ